MRNGEGGSQPEALNNDDGLSKSDLDPDETDETQAGGKAGVVRKEMRTGKPRSRGSSIENLEPEGMPELGIVNEGKRDKEQPSLLPELYEDEPLVLRSGSRHLRS